MITNNLMEVYNRLLNGDCTIYENEVAFMNEKAKSILNSATINQSDVQDVLLLLKISNILYNNNANGYLPLNDSIYDALVVLCKNNNIKYPIGAPPVQFGFNTNHVDNYHMNASINTNPNEKIHVVKFVPGFDKMMYFHTLSSNVTPSMEDDFTIHKDNIKVDKRTRNASHNYDMCGTLDKCKYTLTTDAKREGRYSDPTVQIFDRDFLSKHIMQGIVNPNDIHLIASLKYDGISVENTVSGYTITSSCSRGDTYNDEASDLTPILGGMEFPRAKVANIQDKEFGIKFEYIITDHNMVRLANQGLEYVNRRNAVIGIFGRLDARNYRDYLTPVPLETSLNVDRVTELQFLNKYYTKGVDLRYIEVRGNYQQVLYQINEFVKEADKLREFMPFAYDGVVVEYADENIRRALGKLNAIPRYAIAIKFNPLHKVSMFEYYTYSVGQSGVVVPMAHFKPVEFFGAIHDKTTVHSLARFNKLNLRCGDLVNLTLNNDVIVYLTKVPDEEQDPNNHNPYEEFPTHCPSCGQPLYLSESGDSAYCRNFMCPERCVARLSNMLAKLNIKGYSDQTIRSLKVKTFSDLLDIPQIALKEKLGLNGSKLYMDLQKLKKANYPDYRLIGSIGFTNIAVAKWKLILNNITVQELLSFDDDQLRNLEGINGIGPKIVDTIIKERPFFVRDLIRIFTTFKFTKTEKNSIGHGKTVIFTGFRDPQLQSLFESKGFEVKDSTPSNKTYMLVVPSLGFTSNKVKKAMEIITRRMIIVNRELGREAVNLSNYHQFRIEPLILDTRQAEEFIKSYNP